jgi:hypothetical protein
MSLMPVVLSSLGFMGLWDGFANWDAVLLGRAGLPTAMNMVHLPMSVACSSGSYGVGAILMSP